MAKHPKKMHILRTIKTYLDTFNTNTSQGDSGGPLTYKSGTQHVLIGSVSFGKDCGNAANLYGVFARTSYYRTWIISKMTSPKYCGTSPDAAA